MGVPLVHCYGHGLGEHTPTEKPSCGTAKNNMSVSKNFSLPQEGTTLSGVGESLRATARKPTESGGGPCCHDVEGEGPEMGGVFVEEKKGGVVVEEKKGGVVVLGEEEVVGVVATSQGEHRRVSVSSVVAEGSAGDGQNVGVWKEPRVVLTRLDVGDGMSTVGSVRSRRGSVSSFGRLWGASESKDSDTESFVSMVSERSRVRTQYLKDRRKRPRKPSDQSGSSGEGGPDRPVPKMVAKRRGKGLSEAEKRELLLRSEQEVSDGAAAVLARANSRLSDMTLPSEKEQDEAVLASDLQNQVVDSLAVIRKVASTSGNLKGTFTKALKQAARAIGMAVDELAQRTATEEVAQLRAHNTKLRNEMSELRKEVGLLRADLQAQRSQVVGPAKSQPGCSDELRRSIMMEIGTMVSARIEGLENRLLPERSMRPPLSASKGAQKEAATTSARKEATAVATLVAPANPASTRGQKPGPGKHGKGKGKGKKTLGASVPDAPQPRPLPPAPADLSEGWNVVARKGSKKKAAAAAAAQQQSKRGTGPKAPKAPKAPKLRQPRSAVIALKIQPSAAESSLTYSQVLTQLKAKVDLEELDISDMRFRVASTGARLLEIPGLNSGVKADALAQKLRGVLDENEVQVSRPTKCAELRVSGLDDSVTSEEVAAAVSRVGGCDVGAIKVGEVRRDRAGLGTAWVRCPVAAAKKVSGGRLLVGFVSAKVTLLQQRVLRCFRCHETGHVAAKCSGVDRSAHCFRCGRPGHKQASCSDVPHCPACEDAQRPSGHLAGSAACARICAQSKRRKGGRGKAARPADQARTEAQSRAVEEQPMLT